MSIEKVIMVAKEEFLRKQVSQHLRKKRIDVAECGTIQEAHDFMGKGNFDLMLLDQSLPDGEGAEFLEEVNLRPAKPMVVMMGAEGSVDLAVQCMAKGAFDYLLKPFSNEQVEIILRKAEQFAQVLNVNQFLTSQEAEDPENEILGESEATHKLRKLIRRIAQTNATVLIQGENGTGKELVAHAMHHNSHRKDGPFIKLNCAALPENLVESELFGHEKGSFTGATNKREGRFELAHGGTIFLDEISELSLPLQSKLLRVLQEREFERVGGNRTVKVDVRVVAATNRKLEQSVEKNEFRQDLYFRLNVVPVYVPALRERDGDVPLLAEAFCQRFIRNHGVPVKGLTPESLAALQAHDWPGNIRELQNVLERAVILCGEDGYIHPEQLGLTAPPQAGIGDAPTGAIDDKPIAIVPAAPTTAAASNGAPTTLAELEKQHILSTLKHCEGNRTRTAETLDINIRTLRNKLNEYKEQGEAAD
ncbi:MAG TPA: sigma-54-dependent Fis family transcriptional regulator [Verrucomicrobia bacterium]|nr:sigma-54-dependent Fis family transcriptional regulator [Verrucomicrobiota bacterium]